MSLYDIYNPKRDIAIWKGLADLQGTHLRVCQPRINTTLQKQRLQLYPCNGIRPHMDYQTIRRTQQWSEQVPLFSREIPQKRPVRQTSSNISIRNNGPNEALEYVQAYIDAPTVITRGTLEDHLAKLKRSSGRHDAGLRITAAKSCLDTYKPNNQTECQLEGTKNTSILVPNRPTMS